MNEPIDHTPDGAAKRALVGLRRRRLLLQLASDYAALLPCHPELRREIQSHIDDLLRLASRTRERDCARVLAALREWELTGLTFADLCDETQLSAWRLRSILAELMQESDAIIGRKLSAPIGGLGRPTHIYFLL
jgi:lambda repressor-like predicted transcriptional regulator